MTDLGTVTLCESIDIDSLKSDNVLDHQDTDLNNDSYSIQKKRIFTGIGGIFRVDYAESLKLKEIFVVCLRLSNRPFVYHWVQIPSALYVEQQNSI